MIDFEKIDKKIKPLNDKIYEIDLKFGKEISDELMTRVGAALNSFLEDFKDVSSKSFNYYWKNQDVLKSDSFFKQEIQDINTEDIDNEDLTNTPKFISEYEKKGNKK